MRGDWMSFLSDRVVETAEKSPAAIYKDVGSDRNAKNNLKSSYRLFWSDLFLTLSLQAMSASSLTLSVV